MKILTSILIFFATLMVSCGKEESKLETFNPEAFAYDLGDIWEVNAIINVRGFEQREDANTGSYKASISYSADIKIPEGKTVEDLYSDEIEFNSFEEIMDIPLEVQFELDSTYSLGKYTVIFNIEDNFSGTSTTNFVDFELND